MNENYAFFSLKKIDIIIPYLYIVGLQTKGKFACLVCGPKIKSRRSKSLRMCLMSIGISSLRITVIEQQQKICSMGSRRLH